MAKFCNLSTVAVRKTSYVEKYLLLSLAGTEASFNFVLGNYTRFRLDSISFSFNGRQFYIANSLCSSNLVR